MILADYTKQLTNKEREKLASVTGGFSGHDLVTVCEKAERRWACKVYLFRILFSPCHPRPRCLLKGRVKEGKRMVGVAKGRTSQTCNCIHACTHGIHAAQRVAGQGGWQDFCVRYLAFLINKNLFKPSENITLRNSSIHRCAMITTSGGKVSLPRTRAFSGPG